MLNKNQFFFKSISLKDSFDCIDFEKIFQQLTCEKNDLPVFQSYCYSIFCQ